MDEAKQNKQKFPSLLSSFWLKLIGLITMVIDHFALAGYMDYLGNIGGRANNWLNYDIYSFMRIIGRIAFPIFAFLIVEGIIHTKKPITYLLRLFILTMSLEIGYALYTLVANGHFTLIMTTSEISNPIITLFLGALTLYFLNDKRIWFKFISLIPITFTILCSFGIIPLYLGYSLYGLITILLFYLSIPLAKLFVKIYSSISGLDKQLLQDNYEFLARKLISCILFIIFTLLMIFINPIWNGTNIFIYDAQNQIWALLALIPLFFYSGERGYNAKWFKYGSYIFFPLHIVILFLIFYLI
jgi:hypothetical protein